MNKIHEMQTYIDNYERWHIRHDFGIDNCSQKHMTREYRNVER